MDVEYRAFAQKSELYHYVLETEEKILAETADETAALANLSALLMLELADLNWAGFYRMQGGELVLGPFQGKPAVARIAVGKGVCGTAVAERAVQVVEDVHCCENHIACDINSRSEIVVPVYAGEIIWGVLDIDSPLRARFDAEDAAGLTQFAQRLSAWLTARSGADLAEEVVELLKKRGWHISFAESCTGGLAAGRLVNVASASSVFDGSFVTYANEAKVRMLGVDRMVIDAFGVVSEPVARQMALGTAAENSAEVGVGITGVAGPTGGTEKKPVGMVCFGFAVQGEVKTFTKQFGDIGRNAVRAASVQFVFETLRELLK